MIIIQLFVAFAAAVTLSFSISTINRMTAKTHHGIRAAYVLIACGAGGEIAAIFYGHVPGIAETLFIAGCGLLDFLDRRGAARVDGDRCPLDPDREKCV